MEPPSKCFMRLRLTFAIIGAVCGVMIFFTFGIQYHNWNCAIWGLISGIFASVTLLVHIRWMQDCWANHSRYILPLLVLSGFVMLAGLCSFIAYLSVAIIEHQELSGYGKGFYVTAVWCFMTWKWGFALFYYGRQYQRLSKHVANPGLNRPSRTSYSPI